MPSLRHIHTYEKVGSRKNPAGMWRCLHPDCSHTQREELVKGKRSMCTCGGTFLLDAGALQRKLPKCLMCRNTEDGRRAQSVSNLLDIMKMETEKEELK